MRLLIVEHQMPGEITAGIIPCSAAGAVSPDPVAKWGTTDSNVRASPHPTAGSWGADGLQSTGGKHSSIGTLSKQLCNQRLRQIFTLCFNPDLPASQDK